MNYLDIIREDILKRILQTKENAKLKDTELIRILNDRGANFHRNTINDWRNSKSSSFMDYLDDIAEITDTTVDYLLGRSIDYPSSPKVIQKSEESLVPPLTDDARELLHLYTQLNDEGQAFIKKAARLASLEYKKDASDDI